MEAGCLQVRVIGRRDGPVVTLGGTVVAGQPARPTLAEAKTVAKHRDRLAPAGRAHQFPRAISFNPSMSNA